MTLRSALGCSAVFHVVLLIVRSPLGWMPLGEGVHPLEVSYVPVQAPAPAPPVPVRSDDAGPLRMTRSPASIPVAAARPDPAPAQRPVIRPAVHRWAEVAPPLPIPDTSRMSRQEFAFVEHKERVRRHLKARLHYPAFLSDGTVRLQVLLDPQGDLKQAVVLETSDPRLASIAVQDAQGAAPYPRFPSTRRPKQLRYEFLVRYEPE